MSFTSLTDLYNAQDYFSITAHRGASWSHPENTLSAMHQAVDCGVDFIEFDLRSTRDHIPVLLHDPTIDRTSNGVGAIGSLTLQEVQKFNFSYFISGARQTTAQHHNLTIPTFEEVLAEFGTKVFMNIQIYLDSQIALERMCELFAQYRMFDRAFATVTVEQSQILKQLAPQIEQCLTPGWLERSTPENLRLCRASGARFVQPIKQAVTTDTFKLCHKLGLKSNVFFSDIHSEAKKLRQLGADGVLTNNPEAILQFNL